jgi:dinuclear metal center YbgI/SA1388 family protein
MIVKDFIKIIDNFAPFNLSENWDNTGLLVGDKNTEVTGVITSLDVTDIVIDCAIKNNTNLIIAHHPLLFSPQKMIIEDTGVGSLIIKLIKNEISLIAAHTNLDKSPNGLNQYLAEKIGLTKIKPLITDSSTPYVKIVIYVPKDNYEKVRDTICNAGAGNIGEYSTCTFSSNGIGTFTPGVDTKPYIGKSWQMEIVEEIRLETIANRIDVGNIITEMKKVHPYEDVAYDIIPLEIKKISGGLGRIGVLTECVKLIDFAEMLSNILNYKVNVCGDKERLIKKIALCTGSGSDLWESAYKAGADLYITGEVKHHHYLFAQKAGIAIIDAGHFATEIFAAEILYNEIRKETQDINTYIADEKSPTWR